MISATRNRMVVGILAAVATLALSSPAHAQGGTPARLSALEAQVAALTAQIASLQSGLAAETAAREAAVAAEAAARAAGDVSTLAAANAYADSLAAPATTVITRTGTNVDVVPGAFANAVFVADVPAGSYLAHGIVSATLFGTGLQCDLEVSSLATGEGFRTAFVQSGSLGVTAIPLGGAITLSQPGRAFIDCVPFGGTATVRRAIVSLVRVPTLDQR